MVFVGRETELKQLEDFLQKALNGETQVCFIKGEAGTGKSWLINQFLAKSAQKYENLLFSRGNCNPQTGTTDSYLPFRSILAILTEPDSDNTTESLGSRFRWSLRTLVEVAPDLLGTLIPLPGANVITGLLRVVGKERGWLQVLEERRVADKNQRNIEQSHIFLQYTSFLRELSKQYPLVIILDDLQWVDLASKDLFFHLVRELQKSRILFIGLYRPSDVTAERNGERHPLEQTLNEIKRLYGSIWIDLDQTTEQDGQAFVDQLIEKQYQGLGEKFRKDLFDRTRGHALFTTELLRSMQERRYLRQDPQKHWYESEQLNWKELPAKVEGIIEERIARLSDEMRDILNIACVEGQEFTAQVIAAIQKNTDRELIKQLERQLKQCHHLVQNIGEENLGTVILWKYTFSHALFQEYLYETLPESERRMLHDDIAEALKNLYGEPCETIATHLVRHYREAKKTDKVAKYCQVEGERIFKLGDFNQARNFFNQALEAINDNIAHTALKRAQLKWWIGQTYYNTGIYDSAETYYREAIEIARQLGDDQTIVQALIGLAQTLRRAYDNESAMKAAQEALNIARRTENRNQEASALRVLGIIYGQINRSDERLFHYQEALKIASEIGDVVQKMACLNNIGNVYATVFGDFPKSIEYYQQALALGEQHHRLAGQVIYLECLAMSYRRLGTYGKAEVYTQKHLKLTDQISNSQYASVAYENFGILKLHENPRNIDDAIDQWKKSIRIADEYKRLSTQVDSRNRLLIAYLIKNQLDEAFKVVEETKPLLKKYTANTQVCSEILLEAVVYLRKERPDEANRLFQRTKNTAERELHSQRWAYRYHRAFAQAGIALLAPPTFRSDDFEEARGYFQEAVDTCGWVGILDDALILLREMQKADPDNILKPIETYLVEKREIAWNNLPLND